MTKSLDPFRFLLIAVSGWVDQQQLQLIDYLREENRVLREPLGKQNDKSAVSSAWLIHMSLGRHGGLVMTTSGSESSVGSLGSIALCSARYRSEKKAKENS